MSTTLRRGRSGIAPPAREPKHVRRLLQDMEKIISEYAKPLLDGNRMAWSNLANRRRVDCIEYAKEVEMRRMREDLETAWDARNYARVVEVLEGNEANLSRSEIGKLEYAKKKVQNE